jgi:hypothetical protein
MIEVLNDKIRSRGNGRYLIKTTLTVMFTLKPHTFPGREMFSDRKTTLKGLERFVSSDDFFFALRKNIVTCPGFREE